MVSYSSKYNGVTWDKYANKWKSAIVVDKKGKHLGNFVDELEAAKTYDRAAIYYHGENAKLNFDNTKI